MITIKIPEPVKKRIEAWLLAQDDSYYKFEKVFKYDIYSIVLEDVELQYPHAEIKIEVLDQNDNYVAFENLSSSDLEKLWLEAEAEKIKDGREENFTRSSINSNW